MHYKKSSLWCIPRCTVQECCGTPMWPLSWYWPLKMTDYQSSKCGTFVLPHHPSKFLRTTQGKVFFLTVRAVLCASLFFSYLMCFFSSRGILSISWSQADSELLLSSAKDNRILCWNPNTGEVYHVKCGFLIVLVVSFLIYITWWQSHGSSQVKKNIFF